MNAFDIEPFGQKYADDIMINLYLYSNDYDDYIINYDKYGDIRAIVMYYNGHNYILYERGDPYIPKNLIFNYYNNLWSQ